MRNFKLVSGILLCLFLHWPAEALAESPLVSHPDNPSRQAEQTRDALSTMSDASFFSLSVDEEPEPDSAPPATAEQELSPEMMALRTKVRRVLGIYYPKRLNSRDHNPWEVMHSIIAYGVHDEIHRNSAGGEAVNSVGWLCYNGRCRGQTLLTLENGRVAARKGPYVQGHYGQFLAILAQSRVGADYPMRVGGREFTVADLVETEKLGCHGGMELTFKLISLVHYLDSDATWKNSSGQQWSIPRLIREEIGSPINGAACGGTHRLMALSYAVQKRLRRGEPMDGEYQRAEKYTEDYRRYTFGMQNQDGSFSTEWFERRGARQDLARRIQTTGHILEWIVFSMPDDELEDPRLVKAVDYLAEVLLEGRQQNWSIGPLGHALHALALYDERMFKTPLNDKPEAVAHRQK